MGLFGKLFGGDEKKSCCCDIQIEEVTEEDAPCCYGQDAPSGDAIALTVMGPGCKKCDKLAENAEAAAKSIGAPIVVRHVSDPAAMAEAGIVSTPALLLGDEVVSQGRVLTVSEIAELL